MADRLVGAHMPTKGGLHQALLDGHGIGCTAVQVFTNSPQQWAAKPVLPEKVEKFKEALQTTGITSVVSHDSYLINLAHPTPEGREKSREGLKREIERCALYGIPNVVSHMGAHLGQGEEEGLQLVAKEALQVLAESDDSVTILMETTAGQGSSLNYKFEHLARILDLTKGNPRLAVCLDTCHVFAAGYDIRTKEGYELTFAEFDSKIGLDRLRAIHCNDSKKAFGSRVDRHEHLGEGEIGPTAFECLMADQRFFGVPIVLETPDAETMHAKNLAWLWDLAAKTP